HRRSARARRRRKWASGRDVESVRHTRVRAGAETGERRREIVGASAHSHVRRHRGVRGRGVAPGRVQRATDMKRRMDRFGVTLVELIVVIAIVAVIASVTVLAFRRADLIPKVEPWVSAIAAARRTAVDSARSVSLIVRLGDSVYAATALPDGSIIADA